MEETTTKNEELAETFNSFFSSMVDNLKIDYDIDRQTNVSTDPDVYTYILYMYILIYCSFLNAYK